MMRCASTRRDVRAKVIGEGANLGITQAGRIEFALHGATGGGRINTDFIDNSAGVDCSDNEVNIKIALAAAQRAGTLSKERRNALLAEMTDEVAALVLEDNRLQALALSVAEIDGAQATASQVRLIETLEDRAALDRQTEGLAASDTLSRRAADGSGLTRPELAVLLSSTKLVLQDAIENSTAARRCQPGADAVRLFPHADARQFSQTDRHPPAAPRNRGDQAGEPHRQPPGHRPSVRTGRGGGRGPRRGQPPPSWRRKACSTCPRCGRALETADMPERRAPVAVRPRCRRDAQPDGRPAARGQQRGAALRYRRAVGPRCRDVAEGSDMLLADETQAQSGRLARQPRRGRRARRTGGAGGASVTMSTAPSASPRWRAMRISTRNC